MILDISFNPRPPRKVGATGGNTLSQTPMTGFNPRPPRKVGATTSAGWDTPTHQVSILAHLERWALRPPDRCYAFAAKMQVSILAHLERWALRCAVNNTAGSPLCGFNPRPPRKVGATISILFAKCRTNKVFQSSPTSKGGRYLWRG